MCSFLALVAPENPGHSALLYDPSCRFEAPAGFEVLSSQPLIGPEDPFPLAALPAEAAARGPAPWFPGAAEEFARLTGVTPTTAKLIVAALPRIDHADQDFLPAELRTALGVKAAVPSSSPAAGRPSARPTCCRRSGNSPSTA